MTHEERFTKIENALSALAEHHVQHAEEMRELRRRHDSDVKEIHGVLKGMLDTQKTLIVTVGKVVEAQLDTDQRLKALIDTVDRIVGRDNGHEGRR
jgi:predicted type IV restriction endonuclease